MPYIFAIISAMGYGLNDLFIHIGMKKGKAGGAQALMVNLITSNLVILLAALFVMLVWGLPPLKWRGVLFFALSGMFAPFFGRLSSISAIKLIGATRCNTLRVTDTFFTMVLVLIILGDPIALNAVMGAIILVFGIITLIRETGENEFIEITAAEKEAAVSQSWGLPAFIKLSSAYKGSILAILAALFFALGGMFRQSGLDSIPSAILGTVISSLMALITNSCYSLYTGQLSKENWQLTSRQILFFALAGCGSTVGLLMFFMSLSFGGALTMVATLKNTTPVFTLIFSWLFVRKLDRFSPKLIFSIILVVAGASIIVL